MNKADPATKPALGFSSIYQEHFPAVFRFGSRLLGDPEQALDLSQEVFLKLHAALNGGPAILDVKSWLYRTAANLSYDWLRRKRRYSQLLRSDLEVGRGTRDIETEFIRSEDRKAIRASLEQLGPRDRLLLTLYAEGLRYKEIAQAMGLREMSVGALIARAVQRLSREFRGGGSR
jgi:RNA polymerase sigma factor (sigma-70 family)